VLGSPPSPIWQRQMRYTSCETIGMAGLRRRIRGSHVYGHFRSEDSPGTTAMHASIAAGLCAGLSPSRRNVHEWKTHFELPAFNRHLPDRMASPHSRSRVSCAMVAASMLNRWFRRPNRTRANVIRSGWQTKTRLETFIARRKRSHHPFRIVAEYAEAGRALTSLGFCVHSVFVRDVTFCFTSCQSIA